ncbi:AraC family transcriptional regulator [Maribacter algarum]|uniref:AraC family transcriptional regulator n=1 Tax=Maribacter algarum (ex Zhang et al. 2020) TaxID=2578118 RepID=A0A5S3PH02_9FLAO|nr:AraC family transcriptional regulator [Maribacter algarum]TMM53413.1 AraC family transcriptional regulator [Maribacter algarum]
MKLQFKSSEQDSLSSIVARRVHRPYVGGDWHFHKEFELIYFLKGHGMRIVGDHISNFQKGELVLVGEWLPHLWRNDEDVTDDEVVDFIVVKFPKILGGIDLFSLPELTHIKALLKESNQGILFSGKTQALVHDSLLKLSTASSSEKLISFLGILQTLSKSRDHKILSGPNFSIPKELAGENRLHKVINYISANYSQNISLEEISKIAAMTPPAFCRFFKTRTNKTFSLFLNEVRISKACQLLINGEAPIKQICYDVGFSSLTNFNRTFKNFKDTSPSSFRDRYSSFRQQNIELVS